MRHYVRNNRPAPPLLDRKRGEAELAVPLGLMNRIAAYQERGATLREIATVLKLPVKTIHREVMSWLARIV